MLVLAAASIFFSGSATCEEVPVKSIKTIAPWQIFLVHVARVNFGGPAMVSHVEIGPETEAPRREFQ